jgi:four helix bundle protein
MNGERGTSKGDGRSGNARTWDLEERLLEFSVSVIRLVECLPKTCAGAHLGSQLMRSGTSPLLNHGEAESAESTDYFIHKLRVCLKELRETLRCLKLIERVPLVKDPNVLKPLLAENDELVRIYVASVRTAQSRRTARPG